MAGNVLAAENRTETGKGAGRRLRAVGRIPAVLYGKGVETRSLSVDPRALNSLLHSSGAGLNTLIDLEIGGQSQQVLLKELQREPIGGGFVHADFFQVDLTERVTVSVPIHIVGTAKGVSLEGGILDLPVREVDIECLPTAIPDEIEVDVSALEIGDSIHVSDIVLPADTEMRTDLGLAVATVVAPKAAEEEEAAETVAEGESAEAAAAPEAAEGDSGDGD